MKPRSTSCVMCWPTCGECCTSTQRSRARAPASAWRALKITPWPGDFQLCSDQRFHRIHRDPGGSAVRIGRSSEIRHGLCLSVARGVVLREKGLDTKKRRRGTAGPERGGTNSNSLSPTLPRGDIRFSRFDCLSPTRFGRQQRTPLHPGKAPAYRRNLQRVTEIPSIEGLCLLVLCFCLRMTRRSARLPAFSKNCR